MNKKEKPMKLVHYHIRQDQEQTLDELSKKEAKAKSEIIREALDLYLTSNANKVELKLAKNSFALKPKWPCFSTAIRFKSFATKACRFNQTS